MKRRNVKHAALAVGIVGIVLTSIGPSPARAAEDDTVTTFVEVEQLEYRIRDGKESLNWDAQAWVGGDYHKLWFKTEGEAPVGERVEEAEFQALYSRLVSDFFDLQVGLRQDFKPEPERTFAVVGLHGLARYFVETDLAAFVSHKGEVSFRAKGEIDLRLTQRLVLQPMAEVNLAVQSVAERDIGSGFNDVEFGLRLRYEIAREFAPYIGVNWERKLGETADLVRTEGERVDSFAVVAGLRFWF
jgi:copper resistance protein B